MAKIDKKAAVKVLRSSAVRPIGIAAPGIKSTTLKKSTSSPLDWYEITESTKHVLNTVLAKYVKAYMSEESKAIPDPQKLRKIDANIAKIISINRDHKNFESITVMQTLLQQYGKRPGTAKRKI